MTPGLVLFDLGGVLLRLRGVEEFSAMAGIDDEEALWALWLSSPWVRAFERGECGPLAFAEGMVGHHGLRCTPATFLERFATWPGDLFEGARELVDGVAGRVRTACLSNTNVVHFEQVLQPMGIEGLFPERFLSFHMGHVKPDDDAFHHVLEHTGVAAGAVFFLDDNQLNVDAARALGLRAARARGVVEARAALRAAGVLD